MKRSIGWVCALLGTVLALPAWTGELMSAPVQERLPLERWFDGSVQAVHESTVSSETRGGCRRSCLMSVTACRTAR